MPVDQNRVRDLFLSAWELPLELRQDFLDAACGADAALRGEIERLLAADADPDSLIDPTSASRADAAHADATLDLSQGTLAGDVTEPDATRTPRTQPTTIDQADGDVTTAAATAVPPPRAAEASPRPIAVSTSEGIGAVIAGRYRLLEVIGEGGMGSVYLADQTDPVKRRVALKLIKRGMDSRSVLARFDAERQALALMDHPNIARIFDGGLTPAGQPFFVMELVDGEPLTAYCDRRRLPVKARLELFVSVCQAVQHAHQKGIIHRDLKPGNVLVTEVDGRPTPKVIDFGVAKAIEQPLTDLSFADTGAIVGTPMYMSPEQADPSSMDIDTRTDVYALGVMLYELLTGSPPLDAKDFKRGAVLEMLRMVREVDPPRPSTKLSTAEALPNIAANRSIEPARLTKLLRGELDWVVMRALEKDRDRRYDTADGFARDIQRYLADEVVEARPPSRSYRLRKFVKRNKIQVVAASLVLLTLVGGIVGTSWGMIAARRAEKAETAQRLIANSQRDKAIAAERQTAIQRDKAVAAEARTRTINDFLNNDLLSQAEPAKNAVEDKVTLLEVLDRAAEKVGTRFANQPDLELALRQTIAKTYHGLASWKKSEAQWRAIHEAEQKRDPDSTQRFLALGQIAHILNHRGRSDAEVLEMAESAMKGFERTLGSDNLYTQAAANNLASAYEDAHRVPEAIALLKRIRESQIATLGPDNGHTQTTTNNLAKAYISAGKPNEAIGLLEELRNVNLAKHAPDDPEHLTVLGNLASAYRAVDRLPEAIALFERVRDVELAKLGSEHTSTLATLGNLADAYMAAGRLPEAITLYERARESMNTQLGPDHPATLTSLSNLAMAYSQTNQFDRAGTLLEQLLKLREAKFGPDHVDTQEVRAYLGFVYFSLNRYKEAIPLLEQVYRRSKEPSDFAVKVLIESYRNSGQPDKALPLIEKRLADVKRSEGPDHPESLGMLEVLAMTHMAAGHFDKSTLILENLLKTREVRGGRRHPETQRTVLNLGVNFKEAGRLKEAIPLLEEAYQSSKQHPELRGVVNSLLEVYQRIGDDAKLANILGELLIEARKALPKDSPELAAMLAQLGFSLVRQKKWTEAEPLLRDSLAIREKAQPDLWSTFSTQSILGGALLGQKKYAEAEPLLIKGYEGLKAREKTIPPRAAERFTEAIDRLIELYVATNKPAEVDRYKAARAKYPPAPAMK